MQGFNFEEEQKIKNLEKQVNLIFEVWGNLPNGKKHRINKDLKLYQTVFSYIQNLKQGLPLVSNSGGSANLRYLQSLKITLNTFSNNDKRLIEFIHRKWKTKEIKNLLIKINKDLFVPTSLNHVFWMPVILSPNASDKYFKTGFSHFSIYALNENINDPYNTFVEEFYNLPFARWVTGSAKQKESILLEGYVTSGKASMSTLKNLLSWYKEARDDMYVRKVDTLTQFLKERARLEENWAKLSKSKCSTNKNAYVSESLREKLKNIEEFEL